MAQLTLFVLIDYQSYLKDEFEQNSYMTLRTDFELRHNLQPIGKSAVSPIAMAFHFSVCLSICLCMCATIVSQFIS